MLIVESEESTSQVSLKDRLYSEEELPPEFKLFVPLANKTNKKTFTNTSTQNQGKKVKMIGEEQIQEEGQEDDELKENPSGLIDDKENKKVDV